METDEIFVLVLVAVCVAIVAAFAAYSRRQAAKTDKPDKHLL